MLGLKICDNTVMNSKYRLNISWVGWFSQVEEEDDD